MLNPILKDFWTAERDKELERLVTSSKSWPEISQILGVHRLACVERWRQMGLVDFGEVESSVEKAVESRRKRKEREQQQRQQKLDAQLVQQRADSQEQLMNMREMLSNLKPMQQVDRGQDRLSWNSLLKDEQRYSHHRSWKKKTKLDAFSQLYLMNPGWSAKEETVLIQFVLKHGLDKWDVVAKEVLNERFTAAECRTCWKNLDMPVTSSITYVDKPPSQVESARSSGTSDSNPGSSSTSMSHLSVSGKDAENPVGMAFNNEGEGTWTKKQQVQFWHLWNQHGQNWTQIASAMDVPMVSCKKYFTDITRHLARHGVQQDAALGEENGVDLERIQALARTITQDFKHLPKNLSFSDGDSGDIVDATLADNGDQSTAAEAAASKTSRSQSFVWDKELSVRLQAVIRQAYKSRAIHLDEINWSWVSRRVHPNTTSRVCKNHWKFLHDTTNRVVWTHEDIKKLEEGVRLLGPKKLTQIRDHFLPHMTKDDIARHWFRISDKATVIDENEYYRLLGSIKELMSDTSPATHGDENRHGGENGIAVGDGNGNNSLELEDLQSPRWIEVEKRMGPGWKKMPCRRVWESSFQYLIRHGRWTSNEDGRLLRVVKFVGRDDWYSAAKAMQSGKSPWQCRLRWCQLLDPVNMDTSDLFVDGEMYC
ncbi:Myb-like DNA-binding domain protein [Dissophora ornata]|nr:Myb-like DNA-binding domain protein [Dissophora ornata]